MKGLLVVILSLILSIQGYSQHSKRYSKKELKEIVRAQQRKISELLLKNEDLSKLTARFHIVEEDKFNYLAQKNNLEKKLVEKENEISTKNKEKELFVNSIAGYKKEIAALNIIVLSIANKNSRYSSQPSLQEKRKPNSYINRYYKENTRRYITGPRGGCYYINGNGNKTYVDRSLCR